jgi:8-oxo-dGTP diphosphatase
MNASEQGVREQGRKRYQAIPRTLIFLTSHNPQTGAREILLLKGAPTKRLWANHYNGLGGHIEAGEDVLAAAQRELAEETGLHGIELTLRGIINIDTGRDEMGPRPGVLIFIFLGECRERNLAASAEGAPEWIPVSDLADYPLVDDLYEVIPRTLATDKSIFFGHYHPQPDGTLQYRFVEGH